ncbi:hypothetical protein [Gracilinema caldarium]|uniref:hypothetical protein n=1 Tax=Gracilinema caldarium TaxID=215591 RepID=UPI0026ED5254|nr:hypothetical protein [Gracilinema caldarium]
MGHRSIPFWTSLILILLPLGVQSQPAGLLTNAASKSYKGDQRFWFSVPEEDRLVVNLDGKEIFRGIGSASVLLSAPSGAEKTFIVVAQRRSAPPDNRVLEEQTYSIQIDKQAPQKPAFSASTDDGASYLISASCDDNALLEGIYESNGASRLLKREEGITRFSQHCTAPCSLILWAVDKAGNYSEPITFAAEAAGFTILNPEPGLWANVQQLVISKTGSGEIYWTDDGSDPFGTTHHLYEAPVLITKKGTVTLRVGMTLPNGLRFEKKIIYEASDYDDSPFTIPQHVNSVKNLELNGTYVWKIGTGPWLEKDIPITLVPVAPFKRYIILSLKKDGLIYRYPILLDGNPEDSEVASTAQNNDKKDPLAEQVQTNIQKPQIITAGRLRVLYWNSIDSGVIRYHFQGDTRWIDYNGPVVLSPEISEVAWLLDRGLIQEGPERMMLERQSADMEIQSGRIEYRPFDPVQGSFDVLGLFAGDRPPDFAACAGEDLEWRYISPEGKEIYRVRTDSLPPSPPMLSAPQEGLWISGGVTITSSSPEHEENVQSVIEASLQNPSGTTETKRAVGTLILDVPRESPVLVRLSAYTVDASGNKSSSITRSFTIDSNSVYVSSKGLPSGDGSRNNPVDSLQKAIELAKTLNRSSIRIEGSIVIDTPLSLTSGISLESLPGSSIGGELRVQRKGQLLLPSGTASIRSLSIIATSMEASPLISVQGSKLVLDTVRISVKGTDIRAIFAQQGTLTLENCLINLESSNMATGIRIQESALRFGNTTINVSAQKYGNAVDASGSTYIQEDSSVNVKARDGTVFQFTNMQQALVSRSKISLTADFAAQTCISSGTVPIFKDSVLNFKGNAQGSVVFNLGRLDSISQDTKNTITGNYFIGFAAVLHNASKGFDLQAFNRTFASTNSPNFIAEDL